MVHAKSRSFRQKAFPCLLALVFLSFVSLPVAADEYKDEETLRNATHVLDEMLSGNNVPPDLLSKAQCVIVMPNVKKFGIGIGGTGGRGPMTCREGGSWSAPAMYKLSGASAGLQIGGSSSDIVMLVMDDKGLNSILKGKTKLGEDATVAAGPGATEKGTSGNDILTYAKSKGLFAGVSLGGATVEADNDANKRLYGKEVAAPDILRGNAVQATDAGQPLISLLNNKVAAQNR